jgi:dTMP kinase
MDGLFVTFEGGEGTGKSTHARRLSERLTEAGRSVVLTREPGGSPGAEDLRKLLITGDTKRWSAKAEALLNYAARDAHLRETIKPALERGDIVICDRFIDSTRVYQGYAGGCDMALIDMLEQHIVGHDRPALTLILDVEASQGLVRAKGRGGPGEDRFERMQLSFHQKLREGFREIARLEPERCRLIDSSREPEAVARDIWAAVAPLAGTPS